jgi:hypothetical protein
MVFRVLEKGEDIGIVFQVSFDGGLELLME